MKRLKYSLLTTSFLMIGLCSCINEYLANCPPQHNTLIEFIYGGDNNDLTMFAKKIGNVDLFVFDEEGNLLKEQNQRLSKKDLDLYQGATLTLEPGKYKIVCWANISELTELTDSSSIETAHIQHPNFLTGGRINGNDPLYFGEYELEVPQKGVTSGVIHFKGRHIKMEVYVKNFGDKHDRTSYPIIEMHHVMPQYTIESEKSAPAETSYFPVTTYNIEHDCMQALFHVFELGNESIIDLRHPKTNDRWSVKNLNQFIKAHSIDLTRNEVTISIEIEVTNLGIKITVPKWTIHDITI